MNRFQDLLSGGDLRSIGNSNMIVELISDQSDFDELMECLKHTDRQVVMRTADAIEKISLKNKDYLQKHKDLILGLCRSAKEIELKWHLAQIATILRLNWKEFNELWRLLTNWVIDKKESRIVRVFSLQGLFDLLPQNPNLAEEFKDLLISIEPENIPSINARIRKLKMGLEKNYGTNRISSGN